MTCRNYIPGPNGDCQRCGEMRAGHAGFDTPRDDGAHDKPMGDYTVDDIHNAMRAGHAGDVLRDCLRYRYLRGYTTDYSEMAAQALCAEAMDEWIDKKMEEAK